MFPHFIKIFLLIFLLHGVLSTAGQSATPQWATIKAFLPRWEGSEIVIKINNRPVHYGKIISGIFSYNFQPAEVSEAMLEVKGKNTRHLFFFAEPGVLRITDDGRTLHATGTLNNDRYFQLEKEWDSLAMIETNGSISNVKQFKQHKVASLVANEPASPVSLRMLYRFYYSEKDVSDTSYFRLYQMLSPQLKSTPTGRNIEVEVLARYQVAVGRPAPALELPDVFKILRPVYEKGEYTFIHFWASWCNPCSKFNRSLKTLDSVPIPGLTLVGISLDVNYSAWTHAIKKENLSWKQLSDLKGWNSHVAFSYNIESIPANILVGPDGIIIARNVSIDELRKLIPSSEQKSFRDLPGTMKLSK